jgi:hypothetical protein
MEALKDLCRSIGLMAQPTAESATYRCLPLHLLLLSLLRLLALTAPPQDACPALPGSVLIGNSTSSPTIPPVDATTLPSIRFATLEPCAEWGCRNSYRLTRQSDGSIACIVSEGLKPKLATRA